MWALDHKWTVVLGRLLWVPWTARRSNQSILKEINSEYSLKGLLLKLKYFVHRRWRTDSLEKTLMLGKTEGRKRRGFTTTNRGWDAWMASPTQWTWLWTSSGRWWRTRKPGMLQSTGSQKVKHAWLTEQQQQCYEIRNLQENCKKAKRSTWKLNNMILNKH